MYNLINRMAFILLICGSILSMLFTQHRVIKVICIPQSCSASLLLAITKLANSEDGQQLPQQISCFTKHLRLGSLTGDEVVEVVSTPGVLSSNELGIVCQSIRRKEKPLNLTEISDDIMPRKKLNVAMRPTQMLGSSKQKRYELVLRCHRSYSIVVSMEYNFTLATKQYAIELLPLLCVPKGVTKVDCTTTITKEADPYSPDSSSTHEPVITAKYRGYTRFQVPLCVEGNNVILLPDTKYTFQMKLDAPHWCVEWDKTTYTNDHLTLTLIDSNHFPSLTLPYRVIV